MSFGAVGHGGSRTAPTPMRTRTTRVRTTRGCAMASPEVTAVRSRSYHQGYPRTPSLASSLTSSTSSDQHPTPPDSAVSRPKSILSDIQKPFPVVADVPAQAPSPDASERLQQPIPRRPRPPRPQPPGSFTKDSNTTNFRQRQNSEGVSIVSFTYDSRRKSLTSRSVTSSLLVQRGSQSYIVLITERPNILASLLSYIDFPEFHALCCTSKAMRQLLDERSARDAVLSRFVPGYSLGAADFGQSLENDIFVELRDLEALSEWSSSQRVHVHVIDDLSFSTSDNAFQCCRKRFHCTSTQRTPLKPSPVHPSASPAHASSTSPTSTPDSSSSCGPEHPRSPSRRITTTSHHSASTRAPSDKSPSRSHSPSKTRYRHSTDFQKRGRLQPRQNHQRGGRDASPSSDGSSRTDHLHRPRNRHLSSVERRPRSPAAPRPCPPPPLPPGLTARRPTCTTSTGEAVMEGIGCTGRRYRCRSPSCAP